MIQRRTQTETYWRDQLEFTSDDADRLYDLLLEKAQPVPTRTLIQALMDYHCREEERLIAAELDKGLVYQPRDRYEVGQQIIFPALNYILGTVVDTREGRNPEYGTFAVIQVEFKGEDDLREFASDLEGTHKLNRDDDSADLFVSGELLAPADLYDLYGDHVEDKVIPNLEAHSSFTSFRGKWFLRELLVDVNPGYLNIAEALVEIKAMPLPPAEILAELDLPAEVSEEIRILSVNSALDADERFENVGDMGRDIWYLNRLTPDMVVQPPVRLQIQESVYDRQDISQELLLIEREIDDEGSGEEVMGSSRPIYRTSIALIYPHWREGTLPLTVRTRGLFPESHNHHSPIVLVDGQSGEKMQGWVVHEAAFVYGLKDWFRRNRLPVGAFVKLERTRDPRVITVDFEARRLKRLWIKTAVVEEGRLKFQMRKQPVLCEYDEHLTIGEGRPEALDELWAETDRRGDKLLQIMIRIMPELVTLSPQETVHAKTIYSAVNVLRRTPPGPVFALLSTEPCFVAMGGGYWTFDAALVRP